MKRFALALFVITVCLLSFGQMTDSITAFLDVTSGNSTKAGNIVWLTVTAASSQGTITTEIWDCGNGDLPTGGHPKYGRLAIPNSRQLSGELPTESGCVYPGPGTFTASITVYDSLGASVQTVTDVNVLAP